MRVASRIQALTALAIAIAFGACNAQTGSFTQTDASSDDATSVDASAIAQDASFHDGGSATVDAAAADIDAPLDASQDDAANDASFMDAGNADANTAAGVEVLASGQSSISGIAVDGTRIYWTTQVNAGAVVAMPKGGGTPSALVPAQSHATNVMVDSTTLYWGTMDIFARRALDGGAISFIDFNGAWSMTQDARNLYWMSNYGNSIRQAPKDGGAPLVLAAALPGPLGQIAVDATTVYWAVTAMSPDGMIMETSIDGGTVDIVASGESGPYGLAVDASTMYWTNVLGGTVRSMPLHGGAPTTLASGIDSPYALVLVDDTLYWTNFSKTGSVMKMPATGGAMTTIATGQDEPVAIVVDDTFVYWANFEGGQIMRAPR